LLTVLWLLAQAADSGPWWSQQPTGIDTNLRGVSVVMGVGAGQTPRYVVWASGSNGAVLRSIGGGKDFEQIKMPGAETLDFRDVEAFDEETVYVMSSGEGEKSRVYKTADGGKNWQYSDRRTRFFLDALACAPRTHCVVLSDPVDGKSLVLSTSDGTHWRELPGGRMPPALSQEGAFAASGTAIALGARPFILVLVDRRRECSGPRMAARLGLLRRRLAHDGGATWLEHRGKRQE
jgi:photosystem II stability/assembly factor-like uncharacterized protein